MKCIKCNKPANKRVGIPDPDMKGAPACDKCAEDIILGLTALISGDKKLAKQLLGKRLSKDL